MVLRFRCWAIASVVALLVALALSPPAYADDNASGSTASARAAADLRGQLGLPGLAVRVSTPDGVEDIELGEATDGAKMSVRTPLLIGSVSKSFTAALVMRQVDDAAFGLDDDLSALVDWYSRPGITVRDLLRHSSGYSQSQGLRYADRFESEAAALGRAARDLALEAPDSPAGQYRYSDANYLLLGALLETVTGRNFADLVAEQISGPLGLTQTGARDSTPRTDGHRSWFGVWSRFEPPNDASGAPYGYIVSSVADLDRWAGSQGVQSALGLSGSSRTEMITPQSNAGTDEAGNDMWYGYGWRGGTLGNREYVEHTGATPATFSHVLFVPSEGVRVTVVANGYRQADDAALASLARSITLIATNQQPPAQPAPDELFRYLPWALAVLAGAALAVFVRAARRPLGWLPTALCAIAATGLWLSPRVALGADWRIALIWAPDIGWAALVAAVIFTAVAFSRPAQQFVSRPRR